MLLNLKLCMLQTGIRQNRLAQAMNIDEGLLSRIINGFREPTAEQRRCIAAFLQRDEKWLFERYSTAADLLRPLRKQNKGPEGTRVREPEEIRG